MELRHLRYFITVAELLNFTKAAAKLHVAQPALSRQIRDLEDELGVQLLERSSRFVRLTDAGAAFLTEARAVLQRSEEATQVARAFATGERGELHLGYAPSPTVELLPQALQAFQEECPNVRVNLYDLSGQEMFRRLREGQLDAALTVAGGLKEMRGVAFERLREYPLCLAVSKTHRLARSRHVKLEQIASERLIVYSEREYPEYHVQLSQLFDPLGLKPNIVEEHDSATSLIAAVEANRGISLVAAILARLAGPRLVLRDLRPSPTPLIVGLAYPRKHLSPAGRRFVKTVTLALGDRA